MATPEDLYKELIQILSGRKSEEALEIEILSAGLGPILQDGNFIGISKKALVQAFMIARHVFFDKLVRLDDNGLLATLHESFGDGAAAKDPAVTTEIILLFDCEHLTACNWRKRRLEALIRSREVDVVSGDGMLISSLLERERSLMTTYLCSPLHRHTKSPTLWHHRLWVMTQLMRIWFSPAINSSLVTATATAELLGASSIGSSGSEESGSMEILQRLINAELDVVFRAGEKHPRNYYAFSYMRQLHRALPDIFEHVTDSTTNSKSIDDVFSDLARCILDSTLTWCLAHLRDISGWTFLLYLLQAIRTEQRQRLVVDRVIQFALNVGWEGESLWTFVDLAVRNFGMKVKLFQSGDGEDNFIDNSIEKKPPWKKWAARAKVLRLAAVEDAKTV